MNRDQLDDAARRRRLLYRATHRGTYESDLLVGRFARACIGSLTGEALDDFEALLECSDAELWDWITGRADPPPRHRTPVLEALRKFYAS